MNPELAAIFQGKKTLITGGGGFIGSNLAHQLNAIGARVTVVDNFAPIFGGNPFNLHGITDQIQIIKADIRDEAEMSRILPGQEYLFNLAGQVSHLDSMQDPKTDLLVNALGQITLLELCRKINPGIRIVFGGTRQVYGQPHYLPVDEKHPLEPMDFNGISKMAGEWYHLVSHRVYGLHTTSLRMSNVYGPRMRVRDARKTFIGIWFRKLIQGQEITIYGRGKQLRAFNYVDDVVDALLISAHHPQAEGKVFNLGAPAISLLEMAQYMVKVNGCGSYRFKPFPPERKRIDIGDYAADYHQIQTQLGWQPLTPLEDGIARTFAYYRQHQAQYFL